MKAKIIKNPMTELDEQIFLKSIIEITKRRFKNHPEEDEYVRSQQNQKEKVENE